ncbi:MAG: hypothetical protein WEF86_00605 [Gemmatimonadota bacterium]
MSPERPYHPIDCSIHDRLESAATLRRPVAIAFRSADGEVIEVEARIIDVFARDGVEYLKLEQGREIRLDDLHTVDGVATGD